MANSGGKTQKPRKSPHAGRNRGSEMKTGKRGSKGGKMDSGFLLLLGKGPYASWARGSHKKQKGKASA